MDLSSFNFIQRALEKRYLVSLCAVHDSSRSFKVIVIGTNRNPVCDFLFVFYCNYVPILCYFRDNDNDIVDANRELFILHLYIQRHSVY